MLPHTKSSVRNDDMKKSTHNEELELHQPSLRDFVKGVEISHYKSDVI